MKDRVLRSSFVADVSYNQPKLCPNATWDPVAIIFASNDTVGKEPQTIFVDNCDTVYTANYQNGIVKVWHGGSAMPTRTIMTNYTNSRALVVSIAKDIYMDSGDPNHNIDIWRENTNSNFSSLDLWDGCYSLFLVGNDSVYCSISYSHRVVKRSLNSSDSQVTTVAGTGCAGFHANTLFYQRGIFVTNSSALYVADTKNHRVQLFPAGQLNGTTVAGREALGTILLRDPTAVMLDGDGYLFILDSNHYRVVGSGPYGFRCVIGCTNESGSALDQLSNPQSMAFDSYGNIFVVDTGNNRVQKFFLSSNTCSK